MNKRSKKLRTNMKRKLRNLNKEKMRILKLQPQKRKLTMKIDKIKISSMF